MRVKNEEQKIQYCLRSILSLFDEIVVVDNGSEDRTLHLVQEVKAQDDREDKIKIFGYPFTIARNGPEHDRTPEDSVHNNAYYYNWTLSHCSFQYVCKWDGDMVLRKEAKELFKQFLHRIQTDQKHCWRLSGQTIYRDHAGNYYLSKGEVNKEIGVFPNGTNPRFRKRQHWEALVCRPRLPIKDFEPVAFYELKFVDEDEFSHWSTRDWPSERKKREWTNFHMVKEGQLPEVQFEKLPPNFLENELR